MVSAWLSRQHTARESAPDASAPTRSNVVRRAYDYLRDCGGDVPSIRAVCAVAGVSYATLERGFRETYGMSPKAMTTAMRLSAARRALLRAGETTTVTDVALRTGFVEFGRLSVLYRRHYGDAQRGLVRPAANPDDRRSQSAETPATARRRPPGSDRGIVRQCP